MERVIKVRSVLALWALCLLLTSIGCGQGDLMAGVSLSPSTISPNGDGRNDYTFLSYTLLRPSNVSIAFQDQRGIVYPFREEEYRPKGNYVATFYGNYKVDNSEDTLKVLPDGKYTYAIRAANGASTQESVGEFQVVDAETEPLIISPVTVLPEAFSPNGDYLDDETVITYGLNRKSLVTMIALDASGNEYLLEPEKEMTPVLHSIRWNGTIGERLLPDGKYTIRIRARDKSGNAATHYTVAEVQGGGKPMLEIQSVEFTPKALPVGGVLKIKIRVKNTGETTLYSLGPDSGVEYDTFENFLRFRDDKGGHLYYERPGYWRVGVMWEQAATPYPVRWGWGDKPLAPGEEVDMSGTIKLLNFQTSYVKFWANVIQEGVGYPKEPVGHTKIAISY